MNHATAPQFGGLRSEGISDVLWPRTMHRLRIYAWVVRRTGIISQVTAAARDAGDGLDLGEGNLLVRQGSSHGGANGFDGHGRLRKGGRFGANLSAIRARTTGRSAARVEPVGQGLHALFHVDGPGVGVVRRLGQR